MLPRLDHPSIPRLIDHFEYKRVPILVLDLFEGSSLLEMLAANWAPLPVAQSLTYIRAVCDVLAYLHSQKPSIAFGDVKLQNILVGTNQQCYFVDFADAAAVPLGSLQQDSMMLGKMFWQLLTRMPIDNAHVDVRSLNPSVSQSVGDIIQAAVGRKYKDCIELAKDLALLQL